MTELTNSQLTQLLMQQNETMQMMFKKKMPKTLIKDMKPSVSFEEFLDNIEILSPNKLLNYTLPHYYSLTIMHNLEKIDLKDRPLICSDAKQNKYYYFTNGEWKQDKKFLKVIQQKIFYMVVDKVISLKKLTDNSENTCLCISLFFDVEKYPIEKLLDKIFMHLGKAMPSITSNDDEF